MPRTTDSTRTTIWTWTDRLAKIEGIMFSMAEFEALRGKLQGSHSWAFLWQDYEIGLGRYKEQKIQRRVFPKGVPERHWFPALAQTWLRARVRRNITDITEPEAELHLETEPAMLVTESCRLAGQDHTDHSTQGCELHASGKLVV